MTDMLYKILRKTKILPQKLFVKYHYKHYTGKTLDLEQPKEFNEKIQWLKVYYRPPILPQLVDKYDVRAYVADKVGDTYLNEIYGIYNSEKEIDFEKLPAKFVLKGTHGYDMNLIVKDKDQLEVSEARKMAEKWLSINHYYRAGMEWAYKDIKPRLMVEKLLEEKGKKTVNDYKFYCFDGEPKFLKVDSGRGFNHIRSHFDLQWNRLPFSKKSDNNKNIEVEKPKNFEVMVYIARKLSCGFSFVRVDLYNIDGKVIFGEMTFYPADGNTEYEPDHYNRILGDYITLPEIPHGKKAITTLS